MKFTDTSRMHPDLGNKYGWIEGRICAARKAAAEGNTALHEVLVRYIRLAISEILWKGKFSAFALEGIQVPQEEAEPSEFDIAWAKHNA